MPVYGNTDINDIRTPPQFRGYSFSKFKKIEVRNQILDNMRKGKVEPAIYWCAELVCAGHYLDVWETLMSFFAKYIHLANPRLAVYLAMRFNIFKNILAQGLYTSEIQLRNNGDVRRIFAEVVCIMALSPKKPGFESVKINRVEEFDMTQMPERLKADSTIYIEPIWDKEDPKELTISLNEFAYHVHKKNMIHACYWIEWMVEFNAICNSRKEPTKCHRRGYGVDNKYSREIIWLVWDVLTHYASETGNAFIIKAMSSTNELFCAKYTTATCKKRRYLLYFAVSLLTETVNAAIPIVASNDVLKNVVGQIDNIYSQIKENEHSPNTEYLFDGMDAESNFLRTVQRMEMMNNTDILM